MHPVMTPSIKFPQLPIENTVLHNFTFLMQAKLISLNQRICLSEFSCSTDIY